MFDSRSEAATAQNCDNLPEVQELSPDQEPHKEHHFGKVDAPPEPEVFGELNVMPADHLVRLPAFSPPPLPVVTRRSGSNAGFGA